MSPHRPTPPEEPADTGTRLDGLAEAVTGLARELDALRRGTDPLAGLPARVDELAGVVTDLANKLAAVTARKAPDAVPVVAAGPDRPGLDRRTCSTGCGAGWKRSICATATPPPVSRSAGRSTPMWSRNSCG